MNKYTFSRILPILILIMIGYSSCTDELTGLEINTSRPSDVICFTASLSDTRSASQTRGTSGHLEIEQEDWLVGTEQSVTRGTPVTLLEGSAGVFGYVYDTWQEYVPADGETTAINGTSTWSTLYNKKFVFDGDELTAESDDVRWATLTQPNVRFYAYAPYNLTGGTLSRKEQGGSPQLTYTVNETPANQHDLIVASWEGLSSYKQSIPLVFDHALTAVRFKVGFDCKVTKLEVEGIYNSGTYTFGDRWEVNTTSNDVISNYKFTFGNKIPDTDDDYTGIEFSAGKFLTDGDNTLMMIPQTFLESSDAKVRLTYIEGEETKTITSTLAGKVWQEGKMITYTIHKDEAPTTIYFDLAAGNVMIGVSIKQFNESGTYAHGSGYRGYVYVNGNTVQVQGTHNDNNVYYVYQSTGNITGNYDKTKTGWLEEIDKGECRIPDYSPVTYNGKSWADFITNNTSVDDVIEVWDDGKYVRDNGSDASYETLKDVAVVRNVGRTHTNNHILVKGISKQYTLIVDDIYSTYQYHDKDDFRGRSYGGITYYPNGNTNLTINLIGDNRVGYVHINNQSTDYITFEGTGTLTAANADFITPDDFPIPDERNWNTSYYGISKTSKDRRYISNHRKSAIGNDTKSAGQVYNLTFNSGTIFAGTTKIENCSAIGGGGNGYGQVFINGGTVTAVATTTGAAIGGGIGFTDVGGEGHVTIAGGNVYAYNFANRWDVPSSSIGGGGSKNSVGKLGNINISGGYVYAYSALGTAIGAGSSKAKVGGDATITITGGQVIAKSGIGAGIGGGSSCTGGGASKINGGSATVTISGNPIIRTGSIGGGTTGASNSKIGSANINVSGGDIQAQFVMEAGAKTTPEFTMSGGTIRNSYVDDQEYIHIKKQGGAVYLEDGTFTMSGGTIKNCSAEQGGAVYVNSQSGNSTFTMTGGEIHSCFATGTYNNVGSLINPGHGGAVCLMGGEVNMEGGKIWNNYSENGNGGAVYISNGNFSMSNSSTSITENYPTITGNAAHKGNGGGVFVSSENGKSVTVDLLRGIITNNTANNYGGGICVDMGNTENAATVTVGADGQGVTESNANPKISGNMAMMSGGGLYLRGTNAYVTINSGMIAQNKVSAYVKNQDVANEMGGVTLNDGLVTHVEVTFNGNGGKDSGTETYTQKIVTNTNSKLAPNLFERAGYNFKGWNTRADGLGDSYSEGDAKPHSSDITLYAQWVAQ